MRLPVRPAILCAIALASLLGSCSAPQPKPRVAVAIVIDQLAAWVAEQRLEKLPPAGGFARLRSEGTWVKRCEYTYAITETAPGHAALVKKLFFEPLPDELVSPFTAALEHIQASLNLNASLPPVPL